MMWFLFHAMGELQSINIHLLKTNVIFSAIALQFWGKEFADISEFGLKVSKLWQKIVQARTWARILPNDSSLTEKNVARLCLIVVFLVRLDLTRFLSGTYIIGLYSTIFRMSSRKKKADCVETESSSVINQYDPKCIKLYRKLLFAIINW